MLNERCMQIQYFQDKLRWGYSSRGVFSIKEAYNINTRGGEEWEEIWRNKWIVNPWTKHATLNWLVIKRIIMTGENLKKRGFEGPS